MTSDTSQADADAVLFDVEDGVALITLNRPEAMNAMNRALSSGLQRAWERVQEDSVIRVAVVTGNGRAFCAGADLKERAQTESAGASSRGSVAALIEQGQRRAFGASAVTKPVIAAINGYCLAGGMELALTCDLRIAVEGATFGLPEIVRGFFPGGGGPQRLPRAIPMAVAMEMLLTGDPIDAQAALRAGLVSRVVPSEELIPTAKQLASRIAGHAPLAVAAVKELAYSSQEMELGQSLRFGSSLRWIIGQTDDAKEGPRAFAERREAEFRGR